MEVSNNTQNTEELVDEKVIHPILIISKENFEFDSPRMDSVFYSVLYKLYMRLIPLAGTFTDEEFPFLMDTFKQFLLSVVQKAVEDGHLEAVTPEELENIMVDFNKRVEAEIQKIQEEASEKSPNQN